MLFDYEQEFIDIFTNANISLSVSYVATLMYFRDWTRPISEMPAIITRYSPQFTDEEIEKAFKWAIENNLIYTTSLGKTTIYRVTDDFPVIMESITGINGLANEMIQKKKIRDLTNKKRTKVALTPLGGVSDEGNYQSLLTRLMSAQHSIKAPMFSTHVYEETARVFEEQAKKGVKIQILVSTPKLISKYRGMTTTESPYIQWKRRFKKVKNIEVREFSDESPIELCASYLVDDSLLRMVVFDYLTMPPLDGYLLELSNQSEQNINIIKWYKSKFDSAWENAKYTRIPKFFKRVFSLFTLNIIITSILIYSYFKFDINGLLYDTLLIILGASLSYIGKKILESLRSFTNKLIIAMRNIGI